MNILSLFDGISCGMIALERSGIQVGRYFASEIDKHAICVSKNNYPEIVQLGNILDWKSWSLPKIDLLIGGSPCQDLSVANKNGKGLSGNKSSLFYVYFDILKNLKRKNPNIKFILENVKMKINDKDTITNLLNVQPVLINSAIVSAQKRNRLYWTNIQFNTNIDDKNILVENILEKNVYEHFYLKPDEYSQIEKKKSSKSLGNGKSERRIEFPQSINRKSICLLASDGFKSKNRTTNIIYDGTGARRFTPMECERLQTIPDNYTSCLPIGQRYKVIGNAWTVDVICKILEGI
jgi:DNA-cytosine methyltransferase